MMYIDYLDWDSNFFNLKVGKIIYKQSLHSEYINEIKRSDYDLIYVFNDEKNSYSNLLNSRLVDTKINFTKVLNQENYHLNDENISFYEASILNNDIVDLCITSGEYSRFKLDRGFHEDAFTNLYTTWIKNALNRDKGEKIIVYSIENQHVGLLILSFKEGMSSIEVLAVNEKHRSKGIAKKLINAAFNESCKNNCCEIRVATQKKNLTSCKLYSSCGFELFEATDIYHLWL